MKADERWDVVVIGAGIAGLGAAALLSGTHGMKTLVVDRFPTYGGRLMTYKDYPQRGWVLDVGLHMVELGDKSRMHEINDLAGVEVKWGPFSESVKLFDEDGFKSLSELVPMTSEDRKEFSKTLSKIASLDDSEIKAWDSRSLEEWLSLNVKNKSAKELFADMGMIMTTIPSAGDMAAGEVLYIGRENLQKKKQLLSSSYPIGGMKAMTEGLVKAIEENGGEVRTKTEALEVVIGEGKAKGVIISSASGPYPSEYRMWGERYLEADVVLCALPIYQLQDIIDFDELTSPMPSWWLNRIKEIRNEVTCLIGYMLGLKEPITDELCFFSALGTKYSGFPFQAFPASNFDDSVAPKGKQILHTDIVCEYHEANNRVKRAQISRLMWNDILHMFPGIEEKLEFSIPYYVVGCDGLARKPGLVGDFKPELTAPGVEGLYFAGDTYRGRGLAMNSAALSAMECVELITTKRGLA